MTKILLVEDEANIRKFILINLKKENFQVTEASSQEEAIQKLQHQEFDIALLDIQLPDGNGTDICDYIRKHFPTMGIIMLTAMGTDMDKLMAFETGADDYIVKPFNPLEVVARIKALLRRTKKTQPEAESPTLCYADLEIHFENQSVYKYGKEIHLTPKEYQLLILFAQNPKKCFSREDLLNQVWGENYFGEESTVDVHIRRLREKIEDNTKAPKYIKTAWGIGYQWGGKGDV